MWSIPLDDIGCCTTKEINGASLCGSLLQIASVSKAHCISMRLPEPPPVHFQYVDQSTHSLCVATVLPLHAEREREVIATEVTCSNTQ